MQHTDSPDDLAETAEKIRSGEFFRDGRAMYDLHVHNPMAERYWYILITVLSFVILLVTFFAAQSLYPLQRTEPFIVSSSNIVEDLPHIHTLLGKGGENPSEALLRFMVANYIVLRESYDIDTFDRNVNGIKSQSSDAVNEEFQQYIDPRNPESPVTLYQRHSRRLISIVSANRIKDRPNEMEVLYDATVQTGDDVKISSWQANVSFRYNGLALDEKTDKVNPIEFTVTEYHTKPIERGL